MRKEDILENNKLLNDMSEIICPMTRQNPKGSGYCLFEKCAWFVEEWETCAILDIAMNTLNICDSIDKSGD